MCCQLRIHSFGFYANVLGSNLSRLFFVCFVLSLTALRLFILIVLTNESIKKIYSLSYKYNETNLEKLLSKVIYLKTSL
jgi:hypothetical protein